MLVVKIKSTFSRERARWIPWIEYALMPLHRNFHIITINLRDRQTHHKKVERIRHVEKVCYMRRDYLQEKVKCLEGNMSFEQ
jgi:hypothetical protein